MLYGEDSLDNIKNYDIVILPSFCIDKLEENSVDLVFNSYSLAEMSTESIRYYVDKIRSVSKEYIFHINHTNKSTSLNSDNFGFDKPDEDGFEKFVEILQKNRVNVRIRRSRGKDIDAACGQLANKDNF